MCVNNGNFSTATVNIVQRLTSGTLLFSRGTLRSERCCFLGCSAPLLTWQVKKRERSTGASGEESDPDEHGEQEGESANTSTARLSAGYGGSEWEATLPGLTRGRSGVCGASTAILNLNKNNVLTFQKKSNHLKGVNVKVFVFSPLPSHVHTACNHMRGLAFLPMDIHLAVHDFSLTFNHVTCWNEKKKTPKPTHHSFARN